MRDLPPGFDLVREGGRVGVLASTEAQALSRAGLFRAEELTRGLPRGRVARVTLPTGEAVVRAYRRGGLLGGGRDTYRSPRRFLSELRVTLEARDRGIPVPEPLGFVALTEGGGWRAWAVFRAVPGGRDLREVLAACAGPGEARARLRKVLETVREAHDRGLAHADLNLGNVLLDDGEPPRVFLIDLDRARLGSPRSEAGRFREIARLDRSLEKIFGEALLGREARDELLLGYGEGRPELQRKIRRRLPAHRRALRRHRLLWRWPGRGGGEG
jgi:3-deoxy-D-manno-octulosonic acid kinase